ncbi:MAG: alpha-E domain-containing protein [Coriobacteriales bacterium]|nr:alpha-E domain-containing protein [Coriobacteriales bacterium]
MDSVALSKLDRLFWLGRYIERTLIEIEVMQEAYDQSIDGPAFDYRTFCAELEIPNTYEDTEDFIRRFLFDRKDPYSVISTLNYAYDNAIVLRESISSAALSYIQMAVNIMESEANGVAPMLELQSVTDMLYAFRGCSDDAILEISSRYTLRCGYTIERIDLAVRIGHKPENLNREFSRLNHRMQYTPLRRDANRLMLLLGLAANPDPKSNRAILLDCVEGLFIDV